MKLISGGVTATTDEINILDGVTATKDEINVDTAQAGTVVNEKAVIMELQDKLYHYMPAGGTWQSVQVLLFQFRNY